MRSIRRSRSHSRKLHFVLFLVLLGAFNFGYVIGYTAPALSLMEKEKFLTQSEGSWFGSIITFGMLVGALLQGFLIEKYGRKLAICLANIPLIMGWVTISFGFQLSFLFFGRILTGVSVGMITISVPVYIAEISPRNRRGLYGSFVQLFITLGILIVYFAGIRLNWRTLALVGTVPSFFIILLIRSIPESPRWLIMHGRRPEAVDVLEQLSGPEVDPDEECRDIEEGIEPGIPLSVTELIRPELYQPLKVAAGLMAFQQLTGINVIMYYSTSLFISAGLSSIASYGTALLGIIQFISTGLACLSVDNTGRKPLLIIAGVGMSISALGFGFYYHAFPLTTPADASQADSTLVRHGWIAVCCLVTYIISFSFGWGPVPILMMSEIFPSRARGAASAVTMVITALVMFLVTKGFVNLTAVVGHAGAFWTFSLLCLLATLFVNCYVPETKGKSLEDIELYFHGRALKSLW